MAMLGAGRKMEVWCVSRFGAKEEFMTFMNDFVEREMSSMKQFIQQISVTTTV